MTPRSLSCEFELLVPASPDRVWRAMTGELSRWWPKDFLTSEHTRRMVLEPHLGGRVFEDFGDGGGLIWYHVIGLDVGRELLLAGHLLPPFGGPATTSLRLTLFEQKNGTMLKIRDDRFGVLDDDSPVDGWRHVFDSGLVAYLRDNG